MDVSLQALQAQLETLRNQVNVLEVAVTNLPEKVATIVLASQDVKQPAVLASGQSDQTEMLLGDSHDGHHAFLLDDGPTATSSRSVGQDIAPEVQVQRLTAQLTAAYNRIAALEEQLLAQRMSH